MTTKRVRDAIDELGRVNRQIEELEARAERLRRRIAKSGAGKYNGGLYRAVVSIFDQGRLDLDAVRRKLSARWIEAHTEYSKITRVCVRRV